MTVLLQPGSDAAAEYQIRVVQEDIDHDRVLATRAVTLTPDISGRAEKQRFWMYFRPQPNNGGLHDAAVGGSVKKLEQELKILLTDKNGKTINNLPITQQNIKRVDADPRSGRPDDIRGAKVILCVSDGIRLPARQEFENVDGLSETPMFVVLRPRDLPEDARGYEMVDGIVWLASPAPDPKKPTEEPRYRAIEQYVKQGGMLVVCQGPELSQTKGFETLLPVTVTEMRDSASLDPLPTMGRLTWRDGQGPEGASLTRRVAFAKPKPDALVVRTKQWDEKTASPYLARWRVGSGCVTWIAQDIGESTLVRSLRGGWVGIWDEIMGWRNVPTPRPDVLTANQVDLKRGPYGEAGSRVDVGPSFFSNGGNLGLRASGYILMAVLFFAVYWVVSGPGLYAFLSLKKMATLNWFLFGVAAVAAAGLAMLVVQVLQSGSPELEHVTLLRVPAGDVATVQSRVELYIPRSGSQTLELQKPAPLTTNWITAYPEHPAHVAQAGQFLAMEQYTLPIQDPSSEDPVRVSMPWRRTTKRVQVRWNGEVDGRIEGQVSLTGQYQPDIKGALVNATPWNLHEVYLVYRGMRADGDGSNSGGDRMIYLPRWNKGERINIAEVLMSDKAYRIGVNSNMREALPRQEKVVYGGIEQIHHGFTEVPIGEGWVSYLYAMNQFSGRQLTDSKVDDSNSGYAASMPLCSLFSRIPPMRNEKKGTNYEHTRKDILRIGARAMDVSPAVAAGSLVVLAQARGTLPVPLLVEGDAPSGEGTILCQYILPLGRPAPVAPSTTTAEVSAGSTGTGGVEK